MWRESWRRVTVVVVALVAAACTNADADSTTTTTSEPTTTTAVETTTTTNPPATTTPLETTTSTTVEPTETVGSPEALAAAVNEANANSILGYGVEVPADKIPDLTAGDPAIAARGLYELEAAIVQTAPVDEWFDVLVYPGSPISFQYLSDLQTLSGNQLVGIVRGDGYTVHDTQVADRSELQRVPAEVQAALPDGSVTVVVTSSSGPIDYVDPDGAVVLSNEGWPIRSRLVVVSPSDSGWKLYWSEDV